MNCDLGHGVAIQVTLCFNGLIFKTDPFVHLRENQLTLARLFIVIDLESDAECELLIGAESGVAKFDAEGRKCKCLKLRLN